MAMAINNDDRRAVRDTKLDELREATSAGKALVSGDDWKRALSFAAHFRSR